MDFPSLNITKNTKKDINNSIDTDNDNLLRQAAENMRFVFDSPRRGDVFVSPIWMEDPENPSKKIKIGSLYMENPNSPEVSSKIVSDRPRSELKSGAFWMESSDDPEKLTRLGEIDL